MSGVDDRLHTLAGVRDFGVDLTHECATPSALPEEAKEALQRSLQETGLEG
jgi:hypothetical protein